jgi:hypothetical protein
MPTFAHSNAKKFMKNLQSLSAKHDHMGMNLEGDLHLWGVERS